MKLVALCLFAVCLAIAASANRPVKTIERRKLEEVLRELRNVKESLQHNEKMLNTPPENIEDHCCLSALECFRANMQMHFNVAEKQQSKLFRSLNNPITIRGLGFGIAGNATSGCQSCDSHPKVNVQVFFNRLESLIQKGLSKLSMD